MEAKGTAHYEPVNLEARSEVIRRIKEFEDRLSAELHMPVSVVAYAPQEQTEDLGHA